MPKKCKLPAMLSKTLYLKIVLNVLALIALAVATTWGAIKFQNPVVVVGGALALAGLTAATIRLLNTTNRKLFYFFDAIRNDDYTIHFPENSKDKTTYELHKRLNQVNRQIQLARIENEQKEQYFRALLEHAATGIMAVDRRGYVLHCNSSLKKLFRLDVFTHISQLERINRPLAAAIRNMQPCEQKLVSLQTEGGEIQALLKASSFASKNHTYMLISAQDIKNELDEKELDSWMKLIRVLMHEIMNSIAPITSLSESLCNFFTIGGRPALPHEINETTIQSTLRGLNVIKEQGNGLMTFVESYRKLTRLPKPDRKIFKIKDLAARIKVLYSSLENSQRISLSVTIASPDLELFADENLISQVLINLTKNALQANEKNPEGKIRITAGANPDNRIEIKVIDNGPGIPEEIIEQIFVPFFTTRENGSGIGLSLSRQIMRLHGGSLQVRSVPGKETVFSLIF